MVMRMTEPFQALLALQRALDTTRQSDWFGTETTSTGGFPLINIFRQNDDYVMVAELPGVDKNDLDIQVKNRQVRISGKKSIAYDEKQSVHRRERVSGQFDRTIQIPAQIDADNVKAEYRDGVLALHLPRAESDKPRSVPVT